MTRGMAMILIALVTLSGSAPLGRDLSPWLTPGTHELVIFVHNLAGACAVRASCPALRLATGPGWEATGDGRNWSGARLASAPNPTARRRS